MSHHEQLGASDRLDLRSSSALIAICKEDKTEEELIKTNQAWQNLL